MNFEATETRAFLGSVPRMARFLDRARGRAEEILSNILAVVSDNQTLAEALLGNIDDHSMDNYVAKLIRIAEARNDSAA